MSFKTQMEKMLAGELYFTLDAELTAARGSAHNLINLYNQTTVPEERENILRQLFAPSKASFMIESPFYCAYGSNIYVGNGVYMNFGCVILDCNTVHIGDHVLIGPYVQIYTADHTTDPQTRAAGMERAMPVRIGNNAWIGGGTIILPGVTIGENTTIGAGSVVTKDIPANVVAVGNPCRVIRELYARPSIIQT